MFRPRLYETEDVVWADHPHDYGELDPLGKSRSGDILIFNKIKAPEGNVTHAVDRTPFSQYCSRHSGVGVHYFIGPDGRIMRQVEVISLFQGMYDKIKELKEHCHEHAAGPIGKYHVYRLSFSYRPRDASPGIKDLTIVRETATHDNEKSIDQLNDLVEDPDDQLWGVDEEAEAKKMKNEISVLSILVEGLEKEAL